MRHDTAWGPLSVKMVLEEGRDSQTSLLLLCGMLEGEEKEKQPSGTLIMLTLTSSERIHKLFDGIFLRREGIFVHLLSK